MGTWGERCMQPKSREPGGDKGAWKTVIRPTNSSGPALLPALPFPFARHLPDSLPDHPLPPVDYALRARVPRRGTGCRPSPPSSSSKRLLPHEGLALWLHDCIALPFALLQIVGILLLLPSPDWVYSAAMATVASAAAPCASGLVTPAASAAIQSRSSSARVSFAKQSSQKVKSHRCNVACSEQKMRSV